MNNGVPNEPTKAAGLRLFMVSDYSAGAEVAPVTVIIAHFEHKFPRFNQAKQS